MWRCKRAKMRPPPRPSKSQVLTETIRFDDARLPDEPTPTRDRLSQSKAGPIADGVVKTRRLNQGTSWTGRLGGGALLQQRKATASPSRPCGQKKAWQKWTDAAC